MLRLKPTTIIALDAYAAAFCEAVRTRLDRDFGERGRLIQTHALVCEADEMRFESNLSVIADYGFDSGASGNNEDRGRTEGFNDLFTKNAVRLEAALLEMLRLGRNVSEIQDARREGFWITDERVFYLLLSSPDRFAGSVVLELAQLIRWLLEKRFAGEPCTLHIVVLLPDLFVNCNSSDYSATYALLKRLDDSVAIDNGRPYRQPPFDSCWLMDGRNARALEIGTLADNLASYADAVAGFLSAEPERSGALSSTRVSRGKSPAYSSFGYGELFFPAEIAVNRLSAALARDIIMCAFLPEKSQRRDSYRKLLLAAKQFVLSKSYNSGLENLERDDKGAPIWREFKPGIEIREGEVHEYVAALRRRHEEFERESMIELRNILVERAEKVRSDLDVLLDSEIDNRSDAMPDGLNDSLEFLNVTTDIAIALQQDEMGETPRNFITALRSAQGDLDHQLGVTVDRESTTSLLERAHELRSRLNMLRTSRRLASITSGEPETRAAISDERDEAAREPSFPDSDDNAGTITDEEAISPSLDDEREALAKEIESAEQELRIVSSEYQHAVDREERKAGMMRREAVARAHEERQNAVALAEDEVVKAGDQLREARLLLADLKQERRQFLHKHLIFHPTIVMMLVIGVPLLASIGDIGQSRALIEYAGENWFSLLIGFLVLALAYLGGVLWADATGINRRIKDARTRVDMLDSRLAASAVQLRRARNEQLKIKYDLFAQKIRVETIEHLIETARQRSEDLRVALSALRENVSAFARLFSEATPISSVMRRPLLHAEDIDAYYQKTITNAESEAESFTHDHVRRSQVRRMPPGDFRAELMSFTRKRFARIEQLSIERALLQEPDLVSSTTAEHRLYDLNDAAEPLLRLRDLGSGDDMLAQRDTTLWANADNLDRILKLYRKICPGAHVNSSNNSRTLRVLTRCLNFPAYFLGPIEHYRSCYERDQNKDAADLPDLIPVDAEVARVHKQLLLALAVGLIARRSEGDYFLTNGQQELLGNNRQQIAEKLALDFTSQKLYSIFSEHLDKHLRDNQSIHQRLVELLDSPLDFASSEREMLNELLQKYHPLR